LTFYLTFSEFAGVNSAKGAVFFFEGAVKKHSLQSAASLCLGRSLALGANFKLLLFLFYLGHNPSKVASGMSLLLS
jgi:hypothetical protein